MTSSRGTAAERPSRLRGLVASRWAHWGLLALVMLFTMRGWLNGRLPASPRMEMIVQFTTSWFVLHELRHGRFLTPWNPWEFGGYPWTQLLAWPIYLSVALIGFVGIPMEQALKALMFLGFAASGVAMYELARVVTGRWEAALVSGLAYMIAPFHVQMAIDWWEFVPFWALLPLPFLFYELALRRPQKRARFLALAALSLGLFAFVSPERTFVSAAWFGAYAVLREIVSVRRGESFGRSAARLGLVGGFGALVALAMIVPATWGVQDLGAGSMRAGGAQAGTSLLADYSASPALLLGALLRRIKIPVDTSSLPAIWKSFGGLFAWYLGWPVLGMATLGLAQVRKNVQVWIAALLGVLALWLAFGPTVPFNPFQHLPLFSTLIPHRSLMLVVFFLSFLAGFGVLTLTKLLRRVPAGALAAVILAVFIVDFRPAGDVFGSTTSYFTTDERAAYAFLAAQPGDWRLWEPSSLVQTRYVSTYSLPLAPVERFSGHWVEGAPIHTWEMLDQGDTNTALDVLSVRYALLRKGDPEYGSLLAQARDAGFTSKAFDSPTVEIWEKPDVRPFATLRKPGVPEAATQSAALDALPALVALDVPMVWAGANPQATTALGTAAGGAADGTVQVARESPTRIRVRASTSEPAVLTLSEGWHPNWTVRDKAAGQPSTVRQADRVDYMLLGTYLSPGEHDLLFVYQAPVNYGLFVSTAAIIALIAVAIWNPWKERLSGGIAPAA